jgi:hypothetical protein
MKKLVIVVLAVAAAAGSRFIPGCLPVIPHRPLALKVRVRQPRLDAVATARAALEMPRAATSAAAAATSEGR